MKQLVVGVGEGGISRDRDAVLVTYALGSCVAVMLYDPAIAVAGMLHYMLPDSAMSREKSQMRPWMFADTGIPLLIRAVLELGADKRRLVISAAGGAKVMDESGVFDIGRRNCLALRKILWKVGLVTHVEEIGGSAARTVRLEVGSGRVLLQTAGQEPRELSFRRQNDRCLSA
jgi:chemotaxis protein CheD